MGTKYIPLPFCQDQFKLDYSLYFINFRPNLLNISGFMSKRRGSFSTHLYWE